MIFLLLDRREMDQNRPREKNYEHNKTCEEREEPGQVMMTYSRALENRRGKYFKFNYAFIRWDMGTGPNDKEMGEIVTVRKWFCILMKYNNICSYND